MSGDDVSHADLLAEVKAFREELSYLADPNLKAFLTKFTDPQFQADAVQGVEVIRTARVGGNGLEWLGKIMKPLLWIGGLWIAFQAGLSALAGKGG